MLNVFKKVLKFFLKWSIIMVVGILLVYGVASLTIAIIEKKYPDPQQYPPEYEHFIPTPTSKPSTPTPGPLPTLTAQAEGDSQADTAASPTEEIPQPTNTPTEPSKRNRVVIYNEDPNVGYWKLVSAAKEAGINVTIIDNRLDFYDALNDPSTALVFYPAGQWNRNSNADVVVIKSFEDKGVRAFYTFNNYWSGMSTVFEELYGVRIINKEVINTGGEVILSDTLPTFMLEEGLIPVTSGRVFGRAYLETNQEGDKNYISYDGEDALVYFSSEDKSHTFLLAVLAYDPPNSLGDSYVFFDDVTIDLGANKEVIIRLLQHLLE